MLRSTGSSLRFKRGGGELDGEAGQEILAALDAGRGAADGLPGRGGVAPSHGGQGGEGQGAGLIARRSLPASSRRRRHGEIGRACRVA